MTKVSGWQLWKYETRVDKNNWLYQTDYVFIDPDGIIKEYRFIPSYGCLPITYSFAGVPGAEIVGKPLEFIKRFEGWKKVKTKMTDDELSKGWLLF